MLLSFLPSPKFFKVQDDFLRSFLLYLPLTFFILSFTCLLLDLPNVAHFFYMIWILTVVDKFLNARHLVRQAAFIVDNVFGRWWRRNSESREAGSDSDIKVDAPTVTYGRVWPGMLDILMHLNNAEYATWRERSSLAHYNRSPQFQEALTTLGFSQPMLISVVYRFRRELKCFEQFRIETRTVGWSGDKFVMETKFITTRSNKDGDSVDFINCHSIEVQKCKRLREDTPMNVSEAMVLGKVAPEGISGEYLPEGVGRYLEFEAWSSKECGGGNVKKE